MTPAPSLAALQAGMARAVLTGEAAWVADHVLAGAATPDARLAIYQGNTFGALEDVLADAYPVVRLLVGDRFFSFVARRFVAAAPPTRARLAEYGDAIPDFLAGLEEARSLPYLADVARLEWAVHSAFHAADAAPLDPASLADATDEAAIRLLPHPSCRLVRSDHPVDRIWQAHQDGGDVGRIDLATAAPCRLLVDRSAESIRMRTLDAGEHALLDALFDGETLETAAAVGLAAQPGMDPSATLAAHFMRGTFYGWSDSE